MQRIHNELTALALRTNRNASKHTHAGTNTRTPLDVTHINRLQKCDSNHARSCVSTPCTTLDGSPARKWVLVYGLDWGSAMRVCVGFTVCIGLCACVCVWQVLRREYAQTTRKKTHTPRGVHNRTSEMIFCHTKRTPTVWKCATPRQLQWWARDIRSGVVGAAIGRDRGNCETVRRRRNGDARIRRSERIAAKHVQSVQPTVLH